MHRYFCGRNVDEHVQLTQALSTKKNGGPVEFHVHGIGEKPCNPENHEVSSQLCWIANEDKDR